MGDGGDGRRPPLTILPPPPAKRPLREVIESISPLEIIMATARAAFEAAHEPDGSLNLDRAQRAALIAEPALQYMHPKLAAVVVKSSSDEEDKRGQQSRSHAADAVRLIEGIASRNKSKRA